MCWGELELNSAGHWPFRIKFDDPWLRVGKYALVFALWKSKVLFFVVGFICCHGCVVLCLPSWPLEHSSTCCCGKTSHTAGEIRCRNFNPASAHLHTLPNTVQSAYSDGCGKTWWSFFYRSNWLLNSCGRSSSSSSSLLSGNHIHHINRANVSGGLCAWALLSPFGRWQESKAD